jgi:hypothetical protein
MASLSTGSNTSTTSSTEDGDAMPHVIVKLWPGLGNTVAVVGGGGGGRLGVVGAPGRP